MKFYRIFALPLSFLLLILISGCSSSGGGGDDDGTAPRITAVDFYRCTSIDPDDCNDQQNFFNVGDFYNRWIECTDPDLDMKYRHGAWYHKVNNEYEIYDGPWVVELPTQNFNPIYWSWITNQNIDMPPNSYRFEYQIEDAEGNMSNKFNVYIEVLE